jgi:hypothetical protein
MITMSASRPASGNETTYEYTWTTSTEYVPGTGWVAHTSTICLTETELRQKLHEAGISLGDKFRRGCDGFDEFRGYRTAWKVIRPEATNPDMPPWVDGHEADGGAEMREAVAKRRAETAARSTRTGPDPDDEDPTLREGEGMTTKTSGKAAEIARRLTPAMRDELTAPNPGEGNQRVVGALVRRHLLCPVHMGSQLVHQLTDLGRAVHSVLTADSEQPEPLRQQPEQHH